MADNTTINSMSGGDTIATDDISGVKHQRVKVVIGADGVSDGDVSSTNPMPTTLTNAAGTISPTITDHKSLQVTLPSESKTAFGEALVSELRPVINNLFVYNVNPYLIEDRSNNAGSLAIDTSMLKASSGASANSAGEALSVDRISYIAGIGIKTRFTGLFTSGVANNTQLIGIGDSGEGFFFGYNGTSFGIMSRYGGSPEIRTLTITTASTTAENITITLDGTADATVAVTNSGNTTTTANEIAAHDFSDVGTGWKAKAVGNTVIFTSYQAASKTGSYTLSGATTAVGTFAQTLAGAASTDTWVAQASWNGQDIFDGNGLTGVTLDPTKGNVYQIAFQYLGFGLVQFFIEDPDDGELHLVHAIEYANNNIRPSLDNPTMPLCVASINGSNTSDVIVKSASMAAFVEGQKIIKGINRGIENQTTVSASGNTPILSFRIGEVFNSKLNRSQVKINLISAAADHTQLVQVKFYANATLTGASFSEIDSGNSTLYKDTSATAISGGVYLFTIDLGKSGNSIIDLTKDLDLGEFTAGDMITATCSFSSGTNAKVSVSFNVTERI